MGSYDIVRYAKGTDKLGEYTFGEAQLKCWNGGEDSHGYKVGDTVPEIEKGIHTYFIALREGGFLHIQHNTIARWVEKVEIPIVFDKWGMRFDPETETTQNGLLPNEPYKF